MNGKAAKRIRYAARCFTRPGFRAAAVRVLKKAYKRVPYHRRAITTAFTDASHSARLHIMHRARIGAL